MNSLKKIGLVALAAASVGVLHAAELTPVVQPNLPLMMSPDQPQLPAVPRVAPQNPNVQVPVYAPAGVSPPQMMLPPVMNQGVVRPSEVVPGTVPQLVPGAAPAQLPVLVNPTVQPIMNSVPQMMSAPSVGVRPQMEAVMQPVTQMAPVVSLPAVSSGAQLVPQLPPVSVPQLGPVVQSLPPVALPVVPVAVDLSAANAVTGRVQNIVGDVDAALGSIPNTLNTVAPGLYDTAVSAIGSIQPDLALAELNKLLPLSGVFGGTHLTGESTSGGATQLSAMGKLTSDQRLAERLK